MDQAREQLQSKYSIQSSDLRPSNDDTEAMARANWLWSMLDQEDKLDLSPDELLLLIHSREGSLREVGNIAAHTAYTSLAVDSATSSDLTQDQKASLEKMYKFVHRTEPTSQ